ncbi:Glycosyl transferase family 2 [Rubripirellula amarantea]|uniref:Glycosyl transferase family 2 n=1 Tax=Rubripirellula amarantea TaxID=2527999 RepID=A0A5C5WJR3_9BACT|nr:glycosyltransferase family A protein [Rubripirellula amarantea]TWT51016.1 Glycosyl transferase family 2 [Rubripirellula amarantea]
MRNDVTFCIKTIHRPQCCAALIRSIHQHYGDDRPRIHVIDDGRPELRFSTNCPDEAALVDRLIETDYDIGLSAGRNQLLDAGDTPIVVFTDDDHLVTAETRLPALVSKLNRHHDIDLLAALSNQQERPKMMSVANKTLRIPHGNYKRRGSIRWCHYVGNCFVAYRDILQAIRWDESLKVEEHWDFFWRCKLAGVNVTCDIEHSFKHEHVDPPGYVRRRPEFLKASLRKHGLERVVWK